MDWEIYFENPTSRFDQFVDEEKTIIQADTKEGACAIVRANLLGQLGRITKVYNLTREPVADGAGACLRVLTGRRCRHKGEIDAKSLPLPM